MKHGAKKTQNVIVKKIGRTWVMYRNYLHIHSKLKVDILATKVVNLASFWLVKKKPHFCHNGNHSCTFDFETLLSGVVVNFTT
jgi:hypothetical protein